MEGKALLFLFWIPKPPHIWITCILSSLEFAFFTDWEWIVKMCLKDPGAVDNPGSFCTWTQTQQGT